MKYSEKVRLLLAALEAAGPADLNGTETLVYSLLSSFNDDVGRYGKGQFPQRIDRRVSADGNVVVGVARDDLEGMMGGSADGRVVIIEKKDDGSGNIVIEKRLRGVERREQQ